MCQCAPQAASGTTKIKNSGARSNSNSHLKTATGLTLTHKPANGLTLTLNPAPPFSSTDMYLRYLRYRRYLGTYGTKLVWPIVELVN